MFDGIDSTPEATDRRAAFAKFDAERHPMYAAFDALCLTPGVAADDLEQQIKDTASTMRQLLELHAGGGR